MLLVSVVYWGVGCYLSVLCIEVLVVTCQCCVLVRCYLSVLCIEVLVVTCQCCVFMCLLLLVSVVY